MGFMKRLRSRQKLKDKEKDHYREEAYFPARYTGPDCTTRLDDKILRRIFEFVCPHSTDDSYDASENSVTEGCMLCDMRDLANCTLVRRKWYGPAATLLYTSVRIDAVHYCELEEILHERRKRKSRAHDYIDPPTSRLQQLERTVRENQYPALKVRLLKLPYMTREACKTDLARTVSVLPNLEYVDLPDGFFTGDLTCHTLRQELWGRCPHIRKMKYNEGSEQSLEFLMQGHWQELKIVEISKVRIEPGNLRRVFSMLPWINELSLSDMPWLNDSIFHSAPGIPEFPALETLTMKNLANITHQGLIQYLSVPVCRNTLKTLHLKDCDNVPVAALHEILWAASSLTRLAYIATVDTSLPMDPLPPMASITLKVLNYEIISGSTQQSLYPPSASYYQYLTNALMSNSLPALRQLYVRDPDFPESLTLAPPIRPFADSPQNAPRGFSQPLEVFCKGLDELEWVYNSVMPADAYGRRGSLSGGRPLSSYSASKGLGPQWGGEARRSIVVGNGFGGFLAVPADDDDRPRSAGNLSASPNKNSGVRASWMSHAGREKRGSRADLWR